MDHFSIISAVRPDGGSPSVERLHQGRRTGARRQALRHHPHDVVIGVDALAAGQATPLEPALGCGADLLRLPPVMAYNAHINRHQQPTKREIHAAKHATERVVAGAGALSPGAKEAECLARRQKSGAAVGPVADVASPSPQSTGSADLLLRRMPLIAGLHEQQHGHTALALRRRIDVHPVVARVQPMRRLPDRSSRLASAVTRIPCGCRPVAGHSRFTLLARTAQPFGQSLSLGFPLGRQPLTLLLDLRDPARFDNPGFVLLPAQLRHLRLCGTLSLGVAAPLLGCQSLLLCLAHLREAALFFEPAQLFRLAQLLCCA